MLESIAYGVIMILVVRGLVGLLDDLGVFEDECDDEYAAESEVYSELQADKLP